MQKLIIAILKAALLPAAIMIVGKLFGLIIGNSLFGLNMYIGNDNQGLFSVQLFFTNAQETILANSFSNIFMIVATGIGFLSYLMRFRLYQSSLSNPRTLVKLVRLNLIGWITSNKGGIVETTIWATFLWLSTIVVLAQSINGSSMQWTGVIALVVLILSFWSMVNIFEQEIQKALPKEKIIY